MWNIYRKIVTGLVLFLTSLAGLAVLLIVIVTCLDVILRRCGYPIPGAVDIVQIAACIAAICALPYTTAVKGHVAVEFFFQNLPRTAKIIADGFSRLVMMVLFSVMSVRCVTYGITLMHRNSVSLTLKIPLFWVLWVMAFSLAVVVLVKFYNLAHPGKEMMKP
ncbi:MAG TPA: TRAP transporter small permease [Lentisphaeria bacterium]|nr:TRAP transporter small permease [Lentisphaerota bacterium]OQC12085.1 MAG: Tripartite ATP-independent periplasmic transporter [Lentisphaerae bacterium ADurb.Bin082]HPY89350.1 TRAP transporter small permease [Lentisphaeria bacterium]